MHDSMQKCIPCVHAHVIRSSMSFNFVCAWNNRHYLEQKEHHAEPANLIKVQNLVVVTKT